MIRSLGNRIFQPWVPQVRDEPGRRPQDAHRSVLREAVGGARGADRAAAFLEPVRGQRPDRRHRFALVRALEPGDSERVRHLPSNYLRIRFAQPSV